MAERLLWHCMLDNSYYLFYPLLNQFNVLYKVIKDNKRKPKSTVEEYAEEILVSQAAQLLGCFFPIYTITHFASISVYIHVCHMFT